jgi:hypothetical protein
MKGILLGRQKGGLLGFCGKPEDLLNPLAVDPLSPFYEGEGLKVPPQ